LFYHFSSVFFIFRPNDSEFRPSSDRVSAPDLGAGSSQQIRNTFHL
jgi:hypothetical protein